MSTPTTLLRVPEAVGDPVPAPDDPPGRRRLIATGVLGMVAVGYAVATVALGRHLPLGRDEVVYASQVGRFHLPAYFSAPRARGITWLVAPLLEVTDSVSSLRVYLGVISALGLFVASWPWLRVLGLTSPFVVPAAAALFSAMWLSLFYGNAVMPNLWVAYGALAGTAFLLRRAHGSAHPHLEVLGLAASVGFATLVRPTDGAVLAGLIALAAIPLLRLRALPLVGAASLAFAVAFLPWAVEANDRFGGVLARLQVASGTEGGFLGSASVLLQLRVIDGPILCRPTCRAAQLPPPASGLIWLAVWVVLALAAVIFAARRGSASVALVPIWIGVGMAVPYVLAVGYAAPRFLHPAYAVLSVAVAEGAFAIGKHARRFRWIWAGVVVAAFCVFAVDQHGVAQAITDHHVTSRGKQLRVANELRAAGIRPGCMISGSGSPVLAYALRCQSSAVSGHDTNITREELAAMAGHRQIVLMRAAGSTLAPPAWAHGQFQEGYPAPRHAKRPLWIVLLPVDLAPARPDTGPTVSLVP